MTDTVDTAELTELGVRILAAARVPPAVARTVVLQLILSDAAGHPSHGVRLLPLYLENCQLGHVDATATPTLERDDGSTAMLDGRRAFGQIAGPVLVELGMERAREHGVACVTLRRAGHLARLADIVAPIAEAGLIGLMFANDSGANQVVAPYQGTEARLSTNPVAFAIPRREPPHLVVDMATTVAAEGKLVLAELFGEAVPTEWSIGGVLKPLGAKGFALALVAEVLGGVLTGAGHVGEPEPFDYQGVFLVVVDPSRFLTDDQLRSAVESVAAHVSSAALESEADEIRLPGQRNVSLADLPARAPLHEKTWRTLTALAAGGAASSASEG